MAALDVHESRCKLNLKLGRRQQRQKVLDSACSGFEIGSLMKIVTQYDYLV